MRVWKSHRSTAISVVVSALAGVLTSAAGAGPLYDAAFDERYGNHESRAALDGFAVTAVREGQYDQAISTLEQVLFNDPDDLEARIALARIYFNTGSFDLSRAHAEEALQLARGYPDFETEIKLLLAQLDKAQSRTRAFLDVTVGASYESYSLPPSGFVFPPVRGSASGFGANLWLDGTVVHDLDTPTRDELTFTGHLVVDHGPGDADFDSNFSQLTLLGGRLMATYSGGLPQLADTARFDLSVLGAMDDLGAGRIKTEIGTRARLSFRPSVETTAWVEAGYGWFGASTNYYTTHRFSAETGASARLMPGLTLTGRVSGYWEKINSPVQVSCCTGVLEYDGYGVEGALSLAHLAHVFDDGRTWVQTLTGKAGWQTSIDYGKLAVAFPFSTDRVDISSWEVAWDQHVQTGTNSTLSFGLTYREQTTVGFIGTFPGAPDLTTSWTTRVRFTHRFE